MSTQSNVWDEIQARRATGSLGPDLDAVPAVEHVPSRPDQPASTPVQHAAAVDLPPVLVVEAPAPAAEPVEPQEAFLVPEPEGWTDPLTGTDGPRFWERTIEKEDARQRRYGHGATVALVELTGFEGNRAWYGRDLALQFFARIGRALANEVRTSDYVARIGPARFGIVLVETDEIRAINFIDRLRTACRKEFWAGSGLAVRTGWASATELGGLDAAIALAETRLDDPAYQEVPDHSAR